LASPTNIRLDQKDLPGKNSDYYNIKSFTTLSPGPNVRKFFIQVIYKFSYSARAFLQNCWESLSGINTLAYYENLQNIPIKAFITLPPDVLAKTV
jgi:hypothetical protein